MTQVPYPSQRPSAVPVVPEDAEAPENPSAARAAHEAGRWESRPPRPEHPVGWYRTMDPLFAHEHFGFPADVRPGTEWVASDGSEWTYELNSAKTWEISKYPPEPPAPVDPALAERVEHARLWNAVASALITFCAENDYPRPYFSARNRVATRVWRELHPDSAFGTGPADGDPTGPLRRGRTPDQRMPPVQNSLPPGFMVGYIAELDDDTEGPQFMGFSDDVLPTEDDARERHDDAEAWRPGWRIYQLTDITERPTE